MSRVSTPWNLIRFTHVILSYNKANPSFECRYRRCRLTIGCDDADATALHMIRTSPLQWPRTSIAYGGNLLLWKVSGYSSIMMMYPKLDATNIFLPHWENHIISQFYRTLGKMLFSDFQKFLSFVMILTLLRRPNLFSWVVTSLSSPVFRASLRGRKTD